MIFEGFWEALGRLLGSFWETWEGLGRLLERSARSVFARVASEGSWRAIWEDFGSKKMPQRSQKGCQEGLKIEVFRIFGAKMRIRLRLIVSLLPYLKSKLALSVPC